MTFDQNINVIFKFRELSVFDFRIYFSAILVLMSAWTFEMLTFGKSTTSRTQVQLWYNRFNCRITIRDFVDDVGISFGSRQAIFSDILYMKCVAAKIVSKLLNFEQKQRRKDDIAQEVSKTFNDYSDLFKKVVIGDESWVYGYHNKTKTLST